LLTQSYFWQMLLDITNLPYWMLLASGVLLFLFVIFSGSNDDADLDAEADADFDLNIGGFSLSSALGWLGIGKAPIGLLLAIDFSLWGLFGWMLNVILGAPSNLPSEAIMLVSGISAIAAGRLLARPIGRIFASFGEDASGGRLVGCIGTVSTARLPLSSEGKVGQIDVLDPARNLITVNAVLPSWAATIPQRGDKVLVIERDSQAYVVVVQDSPDQEHWFARSSS